MEQSSASSKRVPPKLPTLPRSQYEDLTRPARRVLEQLELDLKWYLEDIGNRSVLLIRRIQRGNTVKDFQENAKKFLAIILLSLSFCFISGMGYGEVQE